MENEKHPQWEDAPEATLAALTTKPKPMTPKEAIQFQTQPRQEQVVALKTTETGLIDTSDLDGQRNFAMRLMQEGLVSESFKTPQQVILGIQFCKEINIPVLVGLRMLYVVNGKPSLYGEGPLSLCQRSGEVEMIREFFISEKGDEICFANKNLLEKVFGSVTQIKRLNDPAIQEDYFTLVDLKIAGIDMGKHGKKDVWKKFERNMLRYKARALALRTKFSDMISGVNIAEYHDHFDPTNPDILVSKNKLADEIGEYAKEEENKKQEITG